MDRELKNTYSSVQPLEEAVHEELHVIGRCLHLDDVKEAHSSGMLVPQVLRYCNKRLQQKVLWFVPYKSSTKHNFYGNACFMINWDDIVSLMGLNVYLIDQVFYPHRAYSRIVITRNNYDGYLEKLNLANADSPMRKNYGSYSYISRSKGKDHVGPHELQIAIEAGEADAKLIYGKCDILAVDHSTANQLNSKSYVRKNGTRAKYESFACYKFNTAQKRECPYPYTREQSEAELARMKAQIFVAPKTVPQTPVRNYLTNTSLNKPQNIMTPQGTNYYQSSVLASSRSPETRTPVRISQNISSAHVYRQVPAKKEGSCTIL